MEHSNASIPREDLPQHLLEAIHKLHQTGASHQAICSVLELKLEEVQQVLAKAPSQDTKLTESIRAKSKKYRPVTSNRLITSPVLPGNSMKQSGLEANPTKSSELFMLSPKTRPKISEICIENSIYCPRNPQTPQVHEDTLPTFINSYKDETEQLHRISLVTGEHSSH
jgi:hypothetical protein